MKIKTKLLSEWKNWIETANIKNPFAVTLTMRQNLNGEKLDRIKAQRNMKHFLNLINKRFFGNAHRRYGKKVSVFPILEISYSQRLHYHLIMENPDIDRDEEFKRIVLSEWLKTDFGYKESAIKKVYSSGWKNYMLRNLNMASEVDIDNIHF